MAYIDFSDKRNRILNLQELLTNIAEITGDNALLPSYNGIFDNQTKDALMEFQRKSSLPVTGTVDFQTWQKLDSVYNALLQYQKKQTGIYPINLTSNSSISQGEVSDAVIVLQIMLDELRLRYDDIPEQFRDGVFDEIVEEGVRIYQTLNNMDVTGKVDKKTWDRMSDEYNKIIDYRS